MPQKSRYTVDEKVRLVQEYLEGKLSPSEFERTYGSHQRVLRDWVRLYKMRGIEGLTPATHTKKISAEDKTVGGVGLPEWHGFT